MIVVDLGLYVGKIHHDHEAPPHGLPGVPSQVPQQPQPPQQALGRGIPRVRRAMKVDLG
jgi:hypothetical protein